MCVHTHCTLSVSVADRTLAVEAAVITDQQGVPEAGSRHGGVPAGTAEGRQTDT